MYEIASKVTFHTARSIFQTFVLKTLEGKGFYLQLCTGEDIQKALI
jgi:hypothetical protein